MQKQSAQKRYFHGNRNISIKSHKIVMAKDYACGNWCKSQIIDKLSAVSFIVGINDESIWKLHVDQLRPCNSSFRKETLKAFDINSTLHATNLRDTNDVATQIETTEKVIPVSESIVQSDAGNFYGVNKGNFNVNVESTPKQVSTRKIRSPSTLISGKETVINFRSVS